MSTLVSEWAVVAKDIGVIITVVSPPLFLIWRLVIRPRVITPTKEFFGQVHTGLDRLEKMEPKVEVMSTALGANGGKSLADLIHQTSARVSLLIDDLPWPTFEASSNGQYTRINHKFEETFGYSSVSMKENGWKILVHPDDAEGYFRAWEECVGDSRVFRYSARFVTSDRKVFAVSVNASPSDRGSIIVWMGKIHVEVAQ